MRLLERDEVVGVYDAFGARQDTQGWYEDAPLAVLKEQMFGVHENPSGDPLSVLELGAGTGKLAHEIVTELVPSGSRYLGIDISPVMVDLARTRLRDCSDAHAVVGDARQQLPLADGCVDRVVAAYVFDIFSEDEIRGVYAEVARVLVPGGLFGAVSLSSGTTTWSRMTSRLWSFVHTLRPTAVGGCRPVDVLKCIPEGFDVAHASKKVAGGIPSEVIVSRKSS